MLRRVLQPGAERRRRRRPRRAKMRHVVSFRRSSLHPALSGVCAVCRAAALALLLAMPLLLLASLPAPARSASPLNAGNPDAKRLYDDLLSNYNKLVRPVVNSTDRLTVRIKLKLSQLIDVVSRGREILLTSTKQVLQP